MFIGLAVKKIYKYEVFLKIELKILYVQSNICVDKVRTGSTSVNSS